MKWMEYMEIYHTLYWLYIPTIHIIPLYIQVSLRKPLNLPKICRGNVESVRMVYKCWNLWTKQFEDDIFVEILEVYIFGGMEYFWNMYMQNPPLPILGQEGGGDSIHTTYITLCIERCVYISGIFINYWCFYNSVKVLYFDAAAGIDTIRRYLCMDTRSFYELIYAWIHTHSLYELIHRRSSGSVKSSWIPFL